MANKKKKAAAKQRSIRDKYKRRRKNLSHMLDEFINHAKNYAKSNKTRKKGQIQNEIDAAEELKKILPKEEEDYSENFKRLEKEFGL